MKLNIKYDSTPLTHGEEIPVGLFWHPTVDGWSPLYDGIRRPFDARLYTAPRLPVDMGRFNTGAAKRCPNVLCLPIKQAGISTILLPKELLPLKEEIVRVLQYDRHIMGSMWEDLFVHITVHTAIVKRGETLRHPGFHSDGLQGGKFKTKLLAEHSYLVTDKVPTVFAMQPYFVGHLNEDRDNFFAEFDRQTTDRTPLFQALQGHLYLVDPYMVHVSPAVPEDVERTFVRITTAPMELTAPSCTPNPMFGLPAHPERIDVREFLSDPDGEVPLHLYGLQKAPPLREVAPPSVWDRFR